MAQGNVQERDQTGPTRTTQAAPFRLTKKHEKAYNATQEHDELERVLIDGKSSTRKCGLPLPFSGQKGIRTQRCEAKTRFPSASGK